MRQALHIFKKDVLHFRFEIAAAIFVVAALTFIEVRHALSLADPRTNRTAAFTLITILLPLAWWTLIARVIHDEALPGNRQFWITRPYSWRNLLGAKVLFILAFINLPMLVADMAVVRAYGFSLGAELPGLLWSQVLLTIVFLLPIIALSALTTGFVQLTYVILGPCAVGLALAIAAPRFFLIDLAGRQEWVESYFAFLVIGAAALAILFRQYSRRGSTAARSIAVAAAMLVVVGIPLIPRTSAFTVQSWLSKENVDVSSVHAVPDFGRKLYSASDNMWMTTRTFRQGDGTVGVLILYQILGLPSNTTAKVEGFSVGFQAPDGSTSRVDEYSWGNVGDSDNENFLQTGLDPAFSKKVKDGPLKVRVSVYLTIFGDRQTTRVPFGDGSVPVPRVGVCSPRENTNGRGYSLICSSAFRSPSALVSFHYNQSSSGIALEVRSPAPVLVNSYSPFPADLRISPITQEFAFSTAPWQVDQGFIDTMEPLAHVRLDFDVTNLRVAPFRAPQQPISH
jgi:hypothetical protein